MIEPEPKRAKAPSWAWWLLPSFLWFIGGFIAWFFNRHRTQGKYFLLVGLFVTVSMASWVAYGAFSNYPGSYKARYEKQAWQQFSEMLRQRAVKEPTNSFLARQYAAALILPPEERLSHMRDFAYPPTPTPPPILYLPPATPTLAPLQTPSSLTTEERLERLKRLAAKPTPVPLSREHMTVSNLTKLQSRPFFSFDVKGDFTNRHTTATFFALRLTVYDSNGGVLGSGEEKLFVNPGATKAFAISASPIHSEAATFVLYADDIQVYP